MIDKSIITDFFGTHATSTEDGMCITWSATLNGHTLEFRLWETECSISIRLHQSDPDKPLIENSVIGVEGLEASIKEPRHLEISFPSDDRYRKGLVAQSINVFIEPVIHIAIVNV